MSLHPTPTTPPQELALTEYLDLLWQWNKTINLTGVKTKAELETLARESFFLAAFLTEIFPNPPVNFTIWDFGAGAGLPGVPLRIVYDQGDYTMVESRQKRALFLATITARLKLKDTKIAACRAEYFMAQNANPDCIVSRAFMPWHELLPFCKPALSAHSRLIIMANEAPPPLPPGWLLAHSAAYSPGQPANRWFWAIRLQEQDNACLKKSSALV